MDHQFDHHAWGTAAGTVAGYGVILLALFGLFFVVPFLFFSVL